MKYSLENLENFFFCDLGVLAKKLASPLMATQCKSPGKFNLQILASLFGQGLTGMAITEFGVNFSR